MPEGVPKHPSIKPETLARINAELVKPKPQLDQLGEEEVGCLRILVNERVSAQSLVNPAPTNVDRSTETPVELQEVIEKMKATAEKHSNFGFAPADSLAAFLETLPQKLSPDSLATLRALKPRETEESYTVFFKEGTQIFLGESAPSRKGPDGKEGNGVNIAATKAAKESYKNAPNGYYSETGSAEALFASLKAAGAKDIVRTPKTMLKTLQGLKLFSGAVPVEWLSDFAASGSTWYGLAETDYADEYVANDAYVSRGVRALRNVSKELGA